MTYLLMSVVVYLRRASDSSQCEASGTATVVTPVLTQASLTLDSLETWVDSLVVFHTNMFFVIAWTFCPCDCHLWIHWVFNLIKGRVPGRCKAARAAVSRWTTRPSKMYRYANPLLRREASRWTRRTKWKTRLQPCSSWVPRLVWARKWLAKVCLPPLHRRKSWKN